MIGLSTLGRMALLLTDLTAYSKATLWLAGRPVSFFGVAFTEDEMPEDDPIWYERVLFDDAMLRGHFSFRGAKCCSNHSLGPL